MQNMFGESADDPDDICICRYYDVYRAAVRLVLECPLDKICNMRFLEDEAWIERRGLQKKSRWTHCGGLIGTMMPCHSPELPTLINSIAYALPATPFEPWRARPLPFLTERYDARTSREWLFFVGCLVLLIVVLALAATLRGGAMVVRKIGDRVFVTADNFGVTRHR